MKNKKLQVWVRLALLVAIEVAMRLLGLGKVPVGPLNMSFLTLPIAVGAVCMGPVAGMVLGMVFGLFSLYALLQPGQHALHGADTLGYGISLAAQILKLSHALRQQF